MVRNLSFEEVDRSIIDAASSMEGEEKRARSVRKRSAITIIVSRIIEALVTSEDLEQISIAERTTSNAGQSRMSAKFIRLFLVRRFKVALTNSCPIINEILC